MALNLIELNERQARESRPGTPLLRHAGLGDGGTGGTEGTASPVGEPHGGRSEVRSTYMYLIRNGVLVLSTEYTREALRTLRLSAPIIKSAAGTSTYQAGR